MKLAAVEFGDERMTQRKKRTREHVIGDLGENWVERVALKAGFAAFRSPLNDYGVDLYVRPVSDDGVVQAGWIEFQVKATESLERLIDVANERIAIPVYVRDLFIWLGEFYPVVFSVYDAVEEVAYWTYVQRDVVRPPSDTLQVTQTIYVPRSNVVTKAAFQEFASWVPKARRT